MSEYVKPKRRKTRIEDIEAEGSTACQLTCRMQCGKLRRADNPRIDSTHDRTKSLSKHHQTSMPAPGCQDGLWGLTEKTHISG